MLWSIKDERRRKTNKSVFRFLRQLSTWHCPHLLLWRRWYWAPTLAARRPQLSIDFFDPQGAQQQTCRPAAAVAVVDWRNNQADGRTDARSCHTMRTASIIKIIILPYRRTGPIAVPSCLQTSLIGQSFRYNSRRIQAHSTVQFLSK